MNFCGKIQSIVYGVIICLMIATITQLKRVDEKLTLLARPARLFHPAMIESKFPYAPNWEIAGSGVRDRFFYVISQQPLSWLGRGMQVFVFETQDQKYVVKFFILDRVREKNSFSWSSFFVSDLKKKPDYLDRREELFSSSKLSFEELSEETGVVYVHLNKTTDKIHGVKLVDKYGHTHRIRGDNSCFIVQRKASHIIPMLTALMEKKQIAQAQARIDQIFDLLLSLAQKKIYDTDDCLIRNNNIGFVEERAIYIDTGHLMRVEDTNVLERMQYEFRVRLEPLENWLNIAYPSLGEYFRNQRDALLEHLEKSGKDS